jgi:ABC-type Fe3+/spermidine/putrescine transport system ATPase subunit
MSVRENLLYGLKARKVKGAEGKVASISRRLEMDDMLDLRPAGLSSGQKQRVALARALVRNPPVLLLDEPLSHLDASARQRVRRELKVLQREFGYTTIVVTHDQVEALSLADRLAVMRDGQIVQVGPPVEVYGSPATRWAAQFVGEVNVLSGVARGSGVETELGVFDLRAPATGTVHVAVRPEQLELSAREPGGNAEVIAREFRGHDVLYRLRHEGGKTLLVQLPSLELHEVGDRVFVRPAPSSVTALVD